MDGFVYEALPHRVLFGYGTFSRLADEIDRLDLHRVLVLATRQQAQEANRLAANLASQSVGVFAEAAMHTPVDVTLRALEEVRLRQADGLVAVGGGSTTGLAKAIALRTDLPQIIVPTTYAGSEMTPILGETENGVKMTQRSLRVLPEVVIYDVDLTLTLPTGLSGTSGINAIAHAVEALYARDANPVIALIAEEGIRELGQALPRIAADGLDRAARVSALYGSFLCGKCLGAVGMALHHKLCHALGGAFDLPHAETHTILLPHAVAYNSWAAPRAMARIGRALGRDDAAQALFDLGTTVGAPRGLNQIGMPREGIDRAVALAMAAPYWNPAPLEEALIRNLIIRAWEGLPPGLIQ